MPLLEVRDLSVEYHTPSGIYRAVDNLNFSLDTGHSLGLVGESGCGKTTTMLSLLRLLPENGRIVSGEVIFNGIDLMQLQVSELRKMRWKDISIIFQGAMNALNPVRTVEDQIAEVLLHHDIISRSDVKKEVHRLLDMVGVSSSRASQYPHQYSGGMRQRAMIAMALACRPKIIFADEPTTALDVMIQAQMLDLLQELQKELDLAIVMVTHDLGVVAELCDDVLVMYGGKLIEYGSSDAIYNHAQHPYTQRLLTAFPDIENPRAELSAIPGYPPALNDLPPGCRFEPRCHVAKEICSKTMPKEYEVQPNHIASCILLYQDEEIKNG